MKPQAIIIKVTIIIAKVTMKKKLLSINSGLWSLAQQAETHCIQKIPHTSNNAGFD